jgi:hypothetical protein
MIGLASSGTGESPWLWLVIPAGALTWYFVARARSRRTGRPMYYFTGPYPAPWGLQAITLAAIGGASLYNLATGDDQWYWWFAAIAAWLWFGRVVVRRKRVG